VLIEFCAIIKSKKIKKMKKILLLLSITAALVSCTKEEKKETTFVSSEVTLHHGKVWTSLTLAPSGEPKQLAVVLNNDALSSVPVGSGTGHDHQHDNTAFIPVPQKATETTPFKFIMLDWTPSGHQPNQIYTVPHFDIHFYMTPQSEVLNYTDPAKINADPAAEYLPANYVAGPPVPMMGKHWIDVTSPELNGQPFTQTFIYGSHDGNVVFYEPMITLDFLKSNDNFERSIPQPAKVKNSGYYPTKMKIKKKGTTTEVILEGFTYIQAS
jgi:hypothetical protein